MRVTSINSAGSYRYTNHINSRKQQNISNLNAQTGSNVSFQGWRIASAGGIYGALIGFAIGGPVGAALLGGMAVGAGAKTDENKWNKDPYGNVIDSSENPKPGTVPYNYYE